MYTQCVYAFHVSCSYFDLVSALLIWGSFLRLGDGVGGLQVKRGLSKVCASSVNPPPNPDADKGKATSSSSSVADGPPLATILAGVVVFLLFCWVVGSIIMWIVGLIVNAPSS